MGGSFKFYATRQRGIEKYLRISFQTAWEIQNLKFS